MLTSKKLKQEGFTIIEVLIVLAIAGLILLVVLLAVPALQRNARNTTVKSDAQSFAGGFTEYLSNNDGVKPATITASGSTITIGAAGTSQATAKVNGSTTVTVAEGDPTAVAYGTLWWNTGTTCSGDANSRAITIKYYVEQKTAPALSAAKCVDAS